MEMDTCCNKKKKKKQQGVLMHFYKQLGLESKTILQGA